MKNIGKMDSMYLSGGILLSLIWDSLRSKDEDGHDIRLSRKEFMDSFKRIFNPNIKKNAHGNYSSDISKYLTCNFNGSGQIGFFVYGEGDRFDQELHDSEKYKEILHRIQLFADQWIDPSKEKELIRRILFVLSNDAEADKELNYIYPDGREINKEDFLLTKTFYFYDVLLVVIWLCMIKRAKQNIMGRNTFISLFEKLEDRWKYTKDIGDAYCDIKVLTQTSSPNDVENTKHDVTVIDAKVGANFVPENTNGTTKQLIAVNIDGFATWKKTGDKYDFQYLDDNCYRLTPKQMAIISSIIEFSMKNDGFIPATQIAINVSLKLSKQYDEQQISREIQIIRSDNHWKNIVQKTRKGYRINNIYKVENNANVIMNKVESTVFSEPSTMQFSFFPDKSTLSEIYKNVGNPKTAQLQVPIGFSYNFINSESYNTTTLYFDFSGKGHHAIIGASGLGKTTLLQTLITSACHYYSPEDVAISIIDYSDHGRCDYYLSGFTSMPNVEDVVLGFEEGKLIALESDIDNEINRRSHLLRRYDVTSIGEYNQKYEEKEPTLVLLVDDIHSLLFHQPNSSKFIDKVAQLGRNLNIYLVFTAHSLGDFPQELRQHVGGLIYLTCSGDIFPSEICSNFGVGFPSYNIPEEIGFGDGLGWYIDLIKKNHPELIRVEVAGDLSNTVSEPNTTLNSNENDSQNKLAHEPNTDIDIKSIVSRSSIRFYPYQVPIGMLCNDELDNNHIQCLDFEFGHCAVYGAHLSGKTFLLKTLISSACQFNTPNDISFYILTDGGCNMSAFANMPHVGGIVSNFDEDQVSRFIQIISEELKHRQEHFANRSIYCPSINDKATTKSPLIFIVIDNIRGFVDLYPSIEKTLSAIAIQGVKFGIYLVYSALNRRSVPLDIVDSIGMELNLEYSKDMYSKRERRIAHLCFPQNQIDNANAEKLITVAKYAKGLNPKQRNSNLEKTARIIDSKWAGSRPRPLSIDIENFTPQKRCYLIFNDKRIYLNNGSHLIGYDNTFSDIVLTGEYIAPVHAQLRVSNSHAWINNVDFGCKADIYINNEIINSNHQIELNDKDTLKFGDKECVIRFIVGYLELENSISILEPGTHLIGNDKNIASILLNDSSINPANSILVVSINQASILDANSNNGTFVNDERIKSDCSTAIHDGDLITIGNTNIIIHLFSDDELQ